MTHRTVRKYWMILGLGLSTITSLPAQTQSQSTPVGFVKITVPAGTRSLVALPFIPFDDHIQSLFLNQLTGAVDPLQADRVWKWDASNQIYFKATKTDVGQWVRDVESAQDNDLTLNCGEGFWVENRQSYHQSLLLAGRIPLADETSTTFAPGLNLFGYPYAAARDKSETSLQIPGDEILKAGQEPVAGFELGQGYWYHRLAVTPLTWQETRPYANGSCVAGALPEITSLQKVDESTIRLTIACQVDPNEQLALYYQDLCPTSCVDLVNGWQPLNLELSAQGKSQVIWDDSNIPDTVFGRIYWVGQKGQSPVFSSATSISLAGHAGRILSKGDSAVVYVNVAEGDDTLDGRMYSKSNGQGPKKSILGGLQAANHGDIIEVTGGDYQEQTAVFRPNGKQVVFHADGPVRITKKP